MNLCIIRRKKKKNSLQSTLYISIHVLPPLASVSRTGGTAFLNSPESMETLRSRLVLVFSIPPVPLTDWLPTLSPGLLRDNWLVLTPWLPEPMPFEPRWVADPGCCCCACWFTLGIWDRLSPVTCLPWLASLLSGCIWKAGDWGEGLVRRTAGLLVSGVTLLTGDTEGEKKKKSVISILEAGSGLGV